MNTKQRYTLKATERLKSRKAIEQLFNEGKMFSHFPFRIIYRMIDDGRQILQTGFTVGTKHFKAAVNRNRIKRLMKEAYRLQKNELAYTLKSSNKKLTVFFIYAGNEIPEYKFVYEKIGSALTQLIRLIDENGSANS